MSRAHDVALVEIARAQGGLVTAADVRRVTGRADEPRRWIRSGMWQQVLPGVLAPAAIEVTRSLLSSAAMLWEPVSLLSHHEAATREGIWVPDRDRLRITVPFSSRRRSAEGIEVVRTRVFPDGYRTDGFCRWTTPGRTVVDLGMVLTRRQLEAVLLGAVRAGKTSAAEVAAIARGLPGRAGLADVRAVTSLWRAERESLLEERLYEDVAAVVSEDVVRQHRVLDRSGRVVARLDVALVALRMAFEADGLCFHSTDEQIARDHARDRVLLSLGWQTVRFREHVLDNRAVVRREVAALVQRRRLDLRAG